MAIKPSRFNTVLGVLAPCALVVARDGDSDKDSNTGIKQLAISDFSGEQTLGCGLEEAPASQQSLYYPLECVSWHRNNTSIDLKITNLHMGCDPLKHTAHATLESTAMSLRIVGSDVVGGCGWCAYDFSMTILEGAPATSIALWAGSGPHETEPDIDGTIDVTESDGTLCRYSSRLAGLDRPEGKPREPCALSEPLCESELTCHSGLRGYNDNGTGSYCLPQCTNDRDCWSVETCTNGICLISAVW